jgi:hypothetical protein
MPRARTVGELLSSTAESPRKSNDPNGRKKSNAKRRRPTTTAGRRALAVQTNDPVATGRNGGSIVQKGHQGFLTTLTPAIQQHIVEQCREGMPLVFAAQRCRIPKSTVEHWLQAGEAEPDGTFGDFAAEVRSAQGDFVFEAIKGIKQAGFDDAKQWTALMTLLERIYPEYFKRPSDKNVNIQNNIAIGFVERELHRLHEEGVIEYTGE